LLVYGGSVATVKECPKCRGLMVDWHSDTYYHLVVNSNREIVGIRKNVTNLVRCEKCGYTEDNSKEEKIELGVKLPIEFVDALVERVLHYLIHKI